MKNGAFCTTLRLKPMKFEEKIENQFGVAVPDLMKKKKMKKK